MEGGLQLQDRHTWEIAHAIRSHLPAMFLGSDVKINVYTRPNEGLIEFNGTAYGKPFQCYLAHLDVFEHPVTSAMTVLAPIIKRLKPKVRPTKEIRKARRHALLRGGY